MLRAGLVVDDPADEPDGVFHAKSQIVNPLPKVGERAPVLDEPLSCIDPHLDAVVSGRRRDLELAYDAQVVAAERAGVQAVSKGMLLLGRSV